MDIKFDQSTTDISLFVDGDGFLDLDITRDSSEDLQQRLFLRLKTFQRDLSWNTGYGIDYLNTVFGKNRPRSTVDIIIRNEIMKEPMVDSIEYFESEIENFTYSCKFSVKLRFEPEVITLFILTNEDGTILMNESGNILTARI